MRETITPALIGFVATLGVVVGVVTARQLFKTT
jgi:hypothetical protein